MTDIYHNLARIIFVRLIPVIFLVVTIEYYILGTDYYEYFIRQIHHRGWVKSLVYGALVLFGLLAIGLAFCLNSWRFYFGVVFVFIIYSLELSYFRISENGLGFNELELALSEGPGYGINAIISFREDIIQATKVSILFVVFGLILKFTSSRPIPSMVEAGAVILWAFVTLCTFGVIQYSNYTLAKFPAPTRIPATLIYSLLNESYVGDRDRIEQQSLATVPFEKVIWILDESVGADYLSINGYPEDTTPFLVENANSYLNLGVVDSVANCSRTTNLILMSGTQLTDLPDTDFSSLKTPSIFQYAKAAGFETHYISNQSTGLKLQNYMTSKDLKHIDYFSQGEGKYVRPDGGLPEGDLIERLRGAHGAEGRQFIWLVKKGAHFHWELSYPEIEAEFLPKLDEGEPLDRKHRDKALNSYQNSIRWVVDEFLAQTLNFIDLSQTVIIYTADHGQSILEGTSSATHCEWKNVQASQGRVPLILFGEKQTLQTLFEKEIVKDSYSQYQLFGTTLQLFGYDVKETEESIFKGRAVKQVFYAGDIFGRGPWGKYSIRDD